MSGKKKDVFIIIGSAGKTSANEKLIEYIIKANKEKVQFIVFRDLKTLPHFDPDLSINNTPDNIIEFRKSIENADGLIICTPEYIFSIPSGLKNALEWCVSTNIFSGKPTGLITASANGQKGHEELQLITKTVMATFNNETTLLIQGIKGKFDKEGNLNDEHTILALANFMDAFIKEINIEES
jgi:NAD(P)H-dependent FMN reductase